MRPVCLGADLQLPAGHTLRGQVLACFAHAAHVALEDGRLMTLLCGPTQYGMRILTVADNDWPTLRRALAIGDEVTLSDATLRHARVAISLDGVTTWRAPQIDGLVVRLDTDARNRITRNMQIWLDARIAVDHACVPTPSLALWRAAQEEFLDTVDALRDHNYERLDECVRAALGLGPGLTPSADDMMAGLLVALHMTHAPHAPLTQCVQRHWHGTTHASRDVLAQASKGWTTSRMAEVCHALTRPDETTALEAALAAQAAIGAHSGLDTLIGLCAGIALSESDHDGIRILQSHFRRQHTPAFERSLSP